MWSTVGCLLFIISAKDLSTAVASQPACSAAIGQITVTSTLNQSGQWNSVVSINQPPNDDNSWLLGPQSSSSTCKSGSCSLVTVIDLSVARVVLPSPPHDYEFYPGEGYYKYHPERLSWPEGHRKCLSEGGHLIIINSARESELAKNILISNRAGGAWFLTGILEYGVHKEYFTVFGEPLENTGFTQFLPGEDNARGPTDFGAMHRNGLYADITIDVRYPFICEYDLSWLNNVRPVSKHTPFNRFNPLPRHYDLYPGVGYYKYHPETLSWPQAHHVCLAEGGHLIILNSVEESDVAKSILAEFPSAGQWFLTGILEYGEHNKYYTVFGEPLESTGFTDFNPKQTNARSKRDFGGMHRDGRYTDVLITDRYPFICEYDL